MAAAALAPICVAPPHALGLTEDSSELEGASPTAAADEVWVGESARLRRPHRRLLRWVVRSLRQQQQQQQQQQQAAGKDDDSSLPVASSYDSLCSLAGSEQQQLALPPTALVQQQQQPQHQHQQASGGVRALLRAVLRPVVRAAAALASLVGPHGPGNNDASDAERLFNVLTSLPFILIGAAGLRRRRCARGRHFCAAFMAVGLSASAYHGVGLRSPARPLLRRLDYWSIAYTSNVLRRAARIPLPRGAAIAAALVAPFKPTAVTGLNLALVEARYVRQALAHAHLMPSFKLHISTACAGLACFVFEDAATAVGWPPVLHSLWHCLSAMAMGCTNSLLAHLEVALLLEGAQVQALA